MLCLSEVSNEKKRIEITVANNLFTVLSCEDEEYSKELAREVDSSIKSVCASGRSSVTAAAILTAINYRDEINKKDRDIEQLKKQTMSYFEDIVRKGARNNELEKELRRLKKEMEGYRKRLCDAEAAVSRNADISPEIKAHKGVGESVTEEAANAPENNADSEDNSDQIRWNV